MEQIYAIAFMVLGELAVGGTLLLSLPVLAPIGISFYRTNGIVLGITFGLGVIIGGPPRAEWGTTSFFMGVFAVALFFYNLRLWFRNPCSSLVLLRCSLFGNIGLILMLIPYLSSGASGFQVVMLALYSIVSGLLSGAGVLAMLLGHRYLTDPALSIVPLRRLSQIFMGLVFLQFGLAVIHLIAFMPSEQMIPALQLATFNGVYLWSRFAVGLVAPMILAPMILKTVSERATMSATGLLYIAMLMVIIGAIFSNFFLVTQGYRI